MKKIYRVGLWAEVKEIGNCELKNKLDYDEESRVLMSDIIISGDELDVENEADNFAADLEQIYDLEVVDYGYDIVDVEKIPE